MWTREQLTALSMLQLEASATKIEIKTEVHKRGYLTQKALYNVFKWRY